MPNVADLFSGERSSGLEHLEQFTFEGEIGLYEDYLNTLEEFLQSETQKHIDSIKQLRASRKATYDDMPPFEEDWDRSHLERIEEFVNVLRMSSLQAFTPSLKHDW